MSLNTVQKRKFFCAAVYLYLLLLSQVNNGTVAVLNNINNRSLINGNFIRKLTEGATYKVLKNSKRGPLKNLSRSSSWWKDVVLKGKLDQSQWRENFRVGKETFDLICLQLKSALKPKENKLNLYWKRKRILSVEKKVAVGLYYLASCGEYRIVANQFGIHKMTVCKTVHEFVMAVLKILTPQYIKFPNEAEALENSKLFEIKSHIPNIIGAIDGTHIPILSPSEGYRDYVNRKGWPSMILQAIVGPRLQFLDISIKQPGSSHDMTAFISSSFYKNVNNVMPRGTVTVNGRDLPFLIVGDPAYPLLPWLLKGFSGPNLTPIEDSFNAYLSSSRVCVEIAFGRLKARWRCLMKRLDVHHSFVPYIVAACCTLHNIVEKYNEEFVNNWLQAVEEADLLFQQPNTHINKFADDYAGYDMRIFLSEYLAQKYPLRSSKYTDS